jgi:UDPglucose 6-dehydrogenase
MISIIGLGFVGNAIKNSFEKKNISVIGYDKYKNINTLQDCLESDFMYLCLPTQYDENIKKYNKSSINEICKELTEYNYKGLIIIKSTIEPQTTLNLSKKFTNLNIIHNPEFLSANTAEFDFHNQQHIVIGTTPTVSNKMIDNFVSFYKENYPKASISITTSTESESMKIFCNTFYSVKIQFFTELYLYCQKIDCDYNNVVDLMLKNGWINKMHTSVPGSDGSISYGGYCFPKDTNALLNEMKRNDTPCNVLEATIIERNIMRNDNINIISNISKTNLIDNIIDNDITDNDILENNITDNDITENDITENNLLENDI